MGRERGDCLIMSPYHLPTPSQGLVGAMKEWRPVLYVVCPLLFCLRTHTLATTPRQQSLLVLHPRGCDFSNGTGPELLRPDAEGQRR